MRTVWKIFQSEKNVTVLFLEVERVKGKDRRITAQLTSVWVWQGFSLSPEGPQIQLTHTLISATSSTTHMHAHTCMHKHHSPSY